VLKPAQIQRRSTTPEKERPGVRLGDLRCPFPFSPGISNANKRLPFAKAVPILGVLQQADVVRPTAVRPTIGLRRTRSADLAKKRGRQSDPAAFKIDPGFVHPSDEIAGCRL
jgi:hypothetical protein